MMAVAQALMCVVCAAQHSERVDGAIGGAETASSWWASQPGASREGVTGLDADLLDDDDEASDEAVPSEREVIKAARWLRREAEERAPSEEDENTVWQDQAGFLW